VFDSLFYPYKRFSVRQNRPNRLWGPLRLWFNEYGVSSPSVNGLGHCLRLLAPSLWMNERTSDWLNEWMIEWICTCTPLMWLICESRDIFTLFFLLPVISSQKQAQVDQFAKLTQCNNISVAFVNMGLRAGAKFVRRTSRNVSPSLSLRRQGISRGGHCGYAPAFWRSATSIVSHFFIHPACHLLPAFLLLSVTTMTNIITVLFAWKEGYDLQR